MKRCTLSILLSCIISAPVVNASPFLPGSLPVFDDVQYPTKADKADQFIDYLYRIVERENARILKHHQLVKSYQEQIGQNRALSENDARTVARLAKLYDVTLTETTEANLSELSARTLPVPPSLVLAHALSEDLWNPLSKDSSLNLFAMPCLPEDCSKASMTTSVLKPYQDIHAVVEDYLDNINTNSLFQHFRKQRAEDYTAGMALNGERYLSHWKPLLSSEQKHARLTELMETYDLPQYDSWH